MRKCLEPGPQYLQRLERLQRSCLKWLNCRSVLGDKEYVESLIRNRLFPVSYFLVLNDLILLNKVLVDLTSMNASDHWSITFGCPKTRSSKKKLLKPEKHFGNVLKIITLIKWPDSIILCLNLTVFLLFTTQKSMSVSKTKVKSFLEGEAVKRYKYKSYPSGWKVFEKF